MFHVARRVLMSHVWYRSEEKGLPQFRQAARDESGTEKVALRMENKRDEHGNIWEEGSQQSLTNERWMGSLYSLSSKPGHLEKESKVLLITTPDSKHKPGLLWANPTYGYSRQRRSGETRLKTHPSVSCLETACYCG